MQESHRKQSLFAVFLTFTIDSLSATIVFPILAPLFLSPETSIFRGEVPDSLRTILLGLFLGSFPLAQFIFSPIAGELADRKGRKKAFLLTISFAIVGYFLAGWGIHRARLSILFLGRFITGLAAGNMSICLASLVDLSPSEAKKVRYFSYGSIVAGSAFVLGPFIGGKLSDPTVSSVFSPAFPMWVGSVLSILNFVVLWITFRETLQPKVSPGHFDIMKAVHNVQLALRTKNIKDLYLIYFFYLFAWNMIFQFLPALMVEEFNSSNSTIGDASALMGLVWIVGTVVMSFIMHSKLKLKYLLLISLILYSVACIFIALPRELFYFLMVVGIVVFLAGGMWPIFTGAISNAADAAIQGKILGISQSMQSLSMMLAPIFGGFFIHAHSGVPFAISSISALIAAGLLTKADIKNPSSDQYRKD